MSSVVGHAIFDSISSVLVNVLKQHGQRGPLLAYEPYKAFDMPKRLSALASCDSGCNCSTVSCSVRPYHVDYY